MATLLRRSRLASRVHAPLAHVASRGFIAGAAFKLVGPGVIGTEYAYRWERPKPAPVPAATRVAATEEGDWT